jgi:purine-nucleoside phosphorylase
MESNFRSRVQQAAASIRRSNGDPVSLGLILGSGLSDVVDSLFPGGPGVTEIPYGEIDGFGVPSIAGHRGTLSICGSTAVCAGRFHFYEGWSLDDVVLPVATLAELGAKRVIITNAAGGINTSYTPGDLVLLNDHLNLMGQNPLMGPKDEAASARFIDMTEVYKAELRETARSIDDGLKEGVYAALTGPSYETPAEIRMLRTLGADLVGMSTVPEAIAARSYGLEVLGISTVTNLAAGMSGTVLDHAEVVEVSASIRERMVTLLRGLIGTLEQ